MEISYLPHRFMENHDSNGAVLKSGYYLLLIGGDNIAPDENCNATVEIERIEGQGVIFSRDCMIHEIYHHIPCAVLFEVPSEGGRLRIDTDDVGYRDVISATGKLYHLQPSRPLYVSEKEIPVPDMQIWKIVAAAPNSAVLSATASELEAIGDSTAWGYQLMSPPIPVPPKSQLTFSASLMTIQGEVEIGILDEKGSWLVAPQKYGMKINFASGGNNVITVVVANSQEREPYLPSHFKIMKPHLFVQEQRDNN